MNFCGYNQQIGPIHASENQQLEIKGSALKALQYRQDYAQSPSTVDVFVCPTVLLCRLDDVFGLYVLPTGYTMPSISSSDCLTGGDLALC